MYLSLFDFMLKQHKKKSKLITQNAFSYNTDNPLFFLANICIHPPSQKKQTKKKP